MSGVVDVVVFMAALNIIGHRRMDYKDCCEGVSGSRSRMCKKGHRPTYRSNLTGEHLQIFISEKKQTEKT